MLQEVSLDDSERRTQNETRNPETARVPPPTAYEGGTFHHEEDPERPPTDFSERTHDQLPSVESYKATTNDKDLLRSRRTKIVLAVLVFIALMVTFLSIGISIGKRESAVAVVATEKPSKTNTTTASSVKKSRVDEVVTFVSVTTGWSAAEDVEDINSPQFKAARWIADEDPKQYFLDDEVVLRSRYALAVFYFALGGKHWEHELSWMSRHHACNWNENWQSSYGFMPVKVGVVCDEGTNNVTEIFLPANGLVGEIPPEIALLSSLRELDLYKNDVAGAIPEPLKSLSSLTTIVLHDNAMTGSIPSWLWNLPKLTMLDFAQNDLEGFLPHTLPELTALATLNLELNQLKGALTPLKGLKALKSLYLGNNFFTGELTDELLQTWPQLSELDVSDNNITGKLPASLLQSTNLIVIDLHGNDFDGSLPKISAPRSKLEFLALHDNKLTGHISSELKHLTNLKHLDLSTNSFTGTLPSSIGELKALTYLFLAFNPKLTAGSIPEDWFGLTKLVDLSLQRTNRVGSIPGEVDLLKELVMLDLAGNKLSSSIPKEIGNLAELTFLILKDNALTGNLPSDLKNLPALDAIVIDNNAITGGAVDICAGSKTKHRAFITDCEIVCPCCTECCNAVKTCNDTLWFAQQDPVANYEYKRVNYKFPNIIYPPPDSANETQYYETFGMHDAEEIPDDGGGRRY
jgi:Leucine-rich repeat (LRR) protein